MLDKCEVVSFQNKRTVFAVEIGGLPFYFILEVSSNQSACVAYNAQSNHFMLFFLAVELYNLVCSECHEFNSR